MLTALVVAAQIISSAPAKRTAPAPEVSPVPTQIVLDGCNTASAIRAAHIRLTAPESPSMRVLLGEILEQKDGAICLMESEVLVRIHDAGRDQDLVERALSWALASGQAHLVTRAAELAAKMK